jgi:hypothetical protein
MFKATKTPDNSARNRTMSQYNVRSAGAIEHRRQIREKEYRMTIDLLHPRPFFQLLGVPSFLYHNLCAKVGFGGWNFGGVGSAPAPSAVL